MQAFLFRGRGECTQEFIDRNFHKADDFKNVLFSVETYVKEELQFEDGAHCKKTGEQRREVYVV